MARIPAVSRRVAFERFVHVQEHAQCHKNSAEVGDGLGKDNAVQLEQRVQYKNHRQKDKSLAAYGKRERRNGFAHCLKRKIEHKHNADDGARNHQRAEHNHAHADNRRVVNKHADNLARKDKINARQYRTRHKHTEHGKFHDGFHARKIARAIFLA